MLRFQSARAALMAYLRASAELRWRVCHLLNKSDRLVQSVERLLNAGIGNFRSCADACAYLYAGEHKGCSFPGVESWGDEFYGRSLQCGSRVDLWDSSTVPAPFKRARRGKQRALQLLDRTLLRDVGVHGFDFMAAVRKLPHFKPRWEKGKTFAGYPLENFYDGKLISCESRFRKLFLIASDLIESLPLCAQDEYQILSVLSRKLPAVAARHVLSFVAYFPPPSLMRRVSCD
jgi:hypothetical protein